MENKSIPRLLKSPKHNRVVRRYTSVLIFCTISLLASCRNDNEELKLHVPPACFLSRENVVGSPSHTLYEYLSENPVRIAYLRTVADTFDVTEIFPKEILNTNVDKIYPTYASTLIQYDTEFLARLPSSASINSTLNDVTTDERTLSFRYDRNGRMIEVTQRAIRSSAIEFTLRINYDENDNVTRLRYEYPAYTDKITIVTTGYDSNPTPYAGIKGWKFIAGNAIWNSANHYTVLTALSQNNPRGYLHLVNDNESYAITYQYQYNEHAFPTQRDQVYKTETSESQTTYAYVYVCP